VVDLTLFRHLVSRPDAELDLAQAALLIAEPEYPDLDIPGCLELLDELSDSARRARHRSGEPALQRIARHLHQEAGFHGNDEDYYDPRNSYLNEVLQRRTGIPITLAVVILEVARRCGVTAQGISFPGHFIVRGEGPVYVDPFDAELLDADRLRQLHARATGNSREPDSRLLAPASKRAILARMLNNLRAIFAERGDAVRLQHVLDRMQVLEAADAAQPRVRPVN
jgi:regulator of sirC expression with transglutaminase-like and TPR domain